MTGKWIHCRYSGRCACCGYKVKPGAPGYLYGGNLYCRACGELLQAQAHPAPAAETRAQLAYSAQRAIDRGNAQVAAGAFIYRG